MLGLALVCAAQAVATPQRPPNLLFMMADQMRFDRMGCSSGHYPKPLVTPSLDRLAAHGVRFAKHYTSTPTCTPARAAILTGQSPWNHGMLGYGAVAKEYPFEMPRALREQGYFTATIGKDHFGWDSATNLPPLDPKFDAGNKGSGVPHGYTRLSLYDGPGEKDEDYAQWFGRLMPGVDPEKGWPYGSNGWEGGPFMFNESLHPTAWVGQQAVDFLLDPTIAGANRTSPWFLKVSFHRPHSPYDPPQQWLDKVAITDLPDPVYSTDGWDHVFRGGPGDPPGCGPADSQAWCGAMPAAARDLGRRAYQANIMFVDSWVGKILDALTTTGDIDRTFIIWTADHGDGQEDHFHYRKGFPYELSAHIPLLLSWPSDPAYLPDTLRGSPVVPRGAVLDQVVTELRDVFPTFLDAIGASNTVPPNHTIDGSSLLCLLGDPSGKTCNWRQWLDLEHSTVYNNSVHWNALTDGEMKYVFNACDNCGGVLPVEQLFNLTADPGETVDLGQTRSEVTAVWRERMVQQFQREGRGPEWVSPNGTLLLRPPILYGPNYPGNTPQPPGPDHTCNGQKLSAGQPLILEPPQHAQPIQYCQCFSLQPLSSATSVAGPSPRAEPTQPSGDGVRGVLRMEAAWGLCIGVGPGGSELVLADCGTEAAAVWTLSVNNTAPSHVKPQPVTKAGSGQCMTIPSTLGGPVELSPCNGTGAAQGLVFGTGGRLCTPAGCVSVRPVPQPRRSFV
eukprot:m.208673 g.208673  ORF g.208673 m.208673 type:complete len:730 (+) comp15457_c0_seq2:27-2216(+)